MDRRTITFKANEQHLTKTGGLDVFALNTVEYIEAHFDLENNWDSFDSVRAVWASSDNVTKIPRVLNNNGECRVPNELLTRRGVIRVNLVGSTAENGELVERLTTFQTYAFELDGYALIDTNNRPITPTEFEQFVANVKSEVEKVTGLTVAAVTLPEGSDATATYSNGVLTLGIPRGAQGVRGIQGVQGIQGIQGIQGEPFTYEDFTEAQLANLKGEKGDTGERGIQGERGLTGVDGVGIDSIALNNDYTLTINLTDGSHYTTTSIRGPQGPRGEQGPQGIQGEVGPQGPKGDKGDTGEVSQAQLDAAASQLKAEINYLATGENLLSNMSVNLGTAVNKSNGQVGTFSGVTTWATSDLLVIPPNTIKIESNFNNGVGGSSTFGYAVYDSSKVYITGGQNTDEIVMANNYAYIRFTHYSATSTYTGLYVKFTVGKMSAVDNYVLDRFTPLFPVERSAENKYVTVSGGAVGVFSVSGCSYKKFDISAYVGKHIVISVKRVANPYNVFGLVVDSSNALITTISIDTLTELDSYILKVPTNAKHIYVNYATTDNICSVVFAGINQNILTDNQRLAMKACVCFGDSITWYDGNTYTWGKYSGQQAIGFETYLKRIFGMLVLNKGISGATAIQICNSLKDTNLQPYDYMTLTSGANDERHNTPLGTVLDAGSTFDGTTFCGALQSAIEYALTQNPEMKIVLCTPIQGWIYENGYDSTDYPDHPDGGYIDPKWANAIKQIASIYSLPVCDWYAESGLNWINHDVYYNDPEPPTNDLYSLHPTAKGYERMAEILIDTFKRVMPL